MPDVSVVNLLQKAVLWARTGFGRDGDPIVSDTPVELRVRWVGSKSLAQSSQETPEARPVQVDVDRDIATGSRLWLGELADLPDVLAGLEVFTVIDFRKTVDLKGRLPARSVTVQRI
jgi:hypothetical protein